MNPNGYSDMMADANAARRDSHASGQPITFETDFPGFDAAWKACTDEAQFQVWDNSRRSAKTGTAIRRTVKRSSERPNHRTLYIHHTRNLAKMQFFETGEAVGSRANPGVMELLKRHGIEETKHDLSELWVRLRNGAFVQAVGCDDIRDVDRKLGYQWDDILIDECQDHTDAILRRLVDKTLLPTLIDRGGTLTLMGTPPEVEAGLWHELSDPNGEGRFKRHHWTLLENPFIDRANIISVYEGRGFHIDFQDWTHNDPIVQREIFGLHCLDPATLMYCYHSGIEEGNDWPVSGIPSPTSENWRFSIGVDIGGMDEEDDQDAVVVLGWLINDPEHRIWERESWQGKADSEEFLARLSSMFTRWHPMQAGCGDAGADKMLVYFKKRIAFKLLPKPSSLEVSQRLLNDEFRSRRLRVDPIGYIAKAAKVCRKGAHEGDVLAALRYAYHGATAFLGKSDVKPKPTDIDTEIRERRWEQRRKERRELENPWSQEGGWRD